MLWWLQIKSPAAAAVERGMGGGGWGGGCRGSLCGAVQSDQRQKSRVEQSGIPVQVERMSR